MSAMSDYLESAVLNHVLRNTSLTSPAKVYLALFTTDPTDAASGSEVSGGGYLRQQAAFNAPSNGAVTNSADITFPVATASWGTVAYAGVYDSNSGGNLLFHGALSPSKAVATDDQLIFPAGKLTISID